MVYVFIFLFIVIGLCFGWFGNQPYSKRFAQKKATEVKVILEHIHKAETYTKVKDMIGYYSILLTDYQELSRFREINQTAYSQVTSMAILRYQNIHQSGLSQIQKQFLYLNISFKDFYSECLISTLQRQIALLSSQIDGLKTQKAKDKRYDEIDCIVNEVEQDLSVRGYSDYKKLMENVNIPRNPNKVAIELNVGDLCTEYVAKSLGIDKKKVTSLMKENEEYHTPKKMILTNQISELQLKLSGLGKEENPFWRKGYQTNMLSFDATNFLKSCFKKDDIESVYQFLCISQGWQYDGSPYRYYGYARNMFLDMLKKYYPEKDISDLELAILEGTLPDKRFVSCIETEFPTLDSQFVLGILGSSCKKDIQRIRELMETDFSIYVKMSSDCRSDLLSIFVQELPANNIARGFLYALHDDAPAEYVSYALSIYDFDVVNTNALAQRVNYTTLYIRRNNDYNEDFQDTEKISEKSFCSPAGAELKMLLARYGVAERVFLLHDLYLNGSNSPYYKTKTMGINEGETVERLLKDEIIIADLRPENLLMLKKDEMLEFANQLEIDVRKSWTKNKIYDAIVACQEKNSQIEQKVGEMALYRVNPKYESEFEKLCVYQNQILPLVKQLFFI